VAGDGFALRYVPAVSRERGPGVGEIGAGALLVAAVTVRIHNAFALPFLLDFDAAGHLANAADLYGGRLPDPRSWVGFHPPLHHALGAALWQVQPDALPLHVGLRLLSVVAGAGIALLLWLGLRRVFDGPDAAVASASAFCVPAVVGATSMLGNEALCALLATAALVRLLPPRADAFRRTRHAMGTGALAGAATLAKSTGLWVVAVAAGSYAWALRASPRRALVGALAVCGVALFLAAPHYARLAARTGDPMAAVTGAAAAPDLREYMALQPPGERRVADYLRIPAATFTRPVHHAPGLHHSVPGLLYASTWSAAHGALLPLAGPGLDPARRALAALGLLPTALLLVGAVRALRRGALRAALAPQLVFAAGLLAALLAYTWVVPTYSAVKASYLLPAILPGAALLAAGLGALPARARAAARAALLLVAAACTALTAVGWWT